MGTQVRPVIAATTRFFLASFVLLLHLFLTFVNVRVPPTAVSVILVLPLLQPGRHLPTAKANSNWMQNRSSNMCDYIHTHALCMLTYTSVSQFCVGTRVFDHLLDTRKIFLCNIGYVVR